DVRRVQASFGVAEEGVYDIIRGWSDPTTKTRYANLYPYPAVAPSHDTVQFGKKTAKSKTGSYNGTMFKLNDQLYLIDMTAQDTMSLAGRIRGGGASQRLGLLTRIRPLQVNTQAAVTSGGSDVVVGSASIDGNDHQPTGWAGCPPLDSAKAGIRTQSDRRLRKLLPDRPHHGDRFHHQRAGRSRRAAGRRLPEHPGRVPVFRHRDHQGLAQDLRRWQHSGALLGHGHGPGHGAVLGHDQQYLRQRQPSVL